MDDCESSGLYVCLVRTWVWVWDLVWSDGSSFDSDCGCGSDCGRVATGGVQGLMGTINTLL